MDLDANGNNGDDSDVIGTGAIVEGNTDAISGAANPDAEIKRKRGRPVGSGKSGATGGIHNTAESGSGNDARQENRKESTGTKSKPLAVGDLAIQIEALHKMGALVLRNPLIELNKQESERLAAALANVAKHYDIKVNPAVMAWMQLIGVGAAVYGPRIMITNAARKQAAKERQANAPANAMPLTVVPNGQPGKMVYQ